MRSVKWAYLAQRTPAPGTVYLFIVPSFTGNPGMVGCMPLKISYGFLTPSATVRDAAHELGHGVFNLRHTFSNDNIVTLPQSSTQNLMDYPSTSSGQVPGTELFKYQWDNIHDPDGGWFVFEDSDEGAGLNINSIALIKAFRQVYVDKQSFSFSKFYRSRNLNKTNVGPIIEYRADFGNNNIFNICVYLNKVEKDTTKNKININSFKKRNFNRTIHGYRSKPYRTFYWNYTNRDENGLEIAVPEEEGDKFEEYLFSMFLEYFSQAADTAISCAISWSGNSMACNIGVRTAIYFYKNNKVLFPQSPGSGLFKSDQEPYFIGKINNPGKANNIYDDLDDDELTEFEPISNATGCNYPDFEILQEDANNGVAIIGVRKNNSGSGHIVLIMPKSFNEGDEPEVFDIGTKFVSYPICLECGVGTKAIEPFRDDDDILEYKWYKYKN